ncbi:MAG: hypothetical protein QM762_09660 [Chryseolinea sp.]
MMDFKMSATTALIFSLLTITFITTSAQKIKVVEGNLSILKGIKSYDIRFQYDSIIIGTKTSEDDYLAKKKADWNKREAGKGDQFVAMWYDDRKKRYEPEFIKNFEEIGELKLGDKDSKYTILMKSQSLEAGYDVFAWDSAPNINGELWIVESANESKVIVKLSFDQMAGKYNSYYDFDITRKIASAYTKAGKSLGFYVKRGTK